MPDTLDHLKTALADRYAIQRELGRGGMATVYLAEDLKQRRPVAVKILHPEFVPSVGSERFLREIEIAANLTHPHILPVHDSGEVQGLLYYVMPYVEGGSVGERLAREGRLPAEEALRLALEVTEALVYAHAAGIMHLDIKPENMLLQAGKVLVADFGIARVMTDTTGITATGPGVGTAPYMSPEQSLGDHVDGRADIYALGVVLYEMLAGKPPFAGLVGPMAFAQSPPPEPPSLRCARPGLPETLAMTVARAMTPRREDRFQTATELLAALQRANDALRAEAAAGEASGPAPARVAALFGVSAAAGLAAVYAAMKQVGLPPGTFALAAALAAGGLVLLILTGQAERRRSVGAAVGAIRQWLTWRNWAGGGVLALLVWAVTATVLVVGGPSLQDAVQAPRVAVLPFQSLGASTQVYFAAGIAGEIRGELAGMTNVRVIGRASSNAFAESMQSPQEIGLDLGVDYLLTGTVRWTEEGADVVGVEVTPELIDVRTGDLMWRRSFRSASADLFRLQTDIALHVADALGIALAAAERRTMAAPPTTSGAAYDAYLRARAESNRGGDAGALRRARNLFARAVALDSTFVAAWSGLSWVASDLYVATGDPAMGEEARQAAERALALAPNRADGHRALVRYYLVVKGDATSAVEAASRGLRASPGDADVLVQAAAAEQQLGRWDDAVRHSIEAEQLDPRSAATAGATGYLFLRLRRYREAHAAYDRAVVLDSTNLSLIIQRAMVYLAEGALDGAQAVIRDAAWRVDESELALYLATYYDLYWLLSDAQQDAVLRRPPSAYLRGELESSLVRMQLYAFRGMDGRARTYADSARVILDAQLRRTPDQSELLTSLGLALAYLGRGEDAVRAAERSVEILQARGDAIRTPYAEHQLARVYLLAGAPEKAVERLASLLEVPYYVSPGWLRVDPTFASLRNDPRFRDLAEGVPQRGAPPPAPAAPHPR